MNLDQYKAPLYHLSIDNIDTKIGLQFLRENIEQRGDFRSIYFVNAHCFNLSLDDDDYLDALGKSDLLLNDGAGIKIASKLSGIALKENMNGTDFIPAVIECASENGYRVFLLGAKPGVAQKAADTWLEQFPNLQMCGVRSGYFDDSQELVEDIVARETDILIVGMGVPKQELWLESNRHALKNVKIGVAGGAILDFTAGEFQRAPSALRAVGMEWLYRLMQEPKRLFKRYIFGNVRFLWHVLLNRSGGVS